ncbi:MAG: hypothetical protein QXP81_04995 [Nitrososphaerota archaeon]|nr:hypothetical protein [Candidatus Calditenuis fumarioli]
MRRSRYVAPPLLALALLLLFLLMPMREAGSGQLLEIEQLISVPGTGEPNRVTVRVVVLHSVDWGPPRRARFAEAVVMVGSEVRRVSFNGEAVFQVRVGNHTVSVYWADGRFPAFRTSVQVQQDTEVTVQFTELRVRPQAIEVVADRQMGRSLVTVTAVAPVSGDFYVATPVIRYVDWEGEVLVHPFMTRADLVSVMPYSLDRSRLAASADEETGLGDAAIDAQSNVIRIETTVQDVIAAVLEGSYVPVLVMNHTVRAVAR